jgi:hypothetical protein
MTKPVGTHDPGWQHLDTLRINRLRAPEDEFNEAANLMVRDRAKKRRKRRKT